MRVVVTALLLFATFAATAAERSYGVLSLVGDKLLIASAQMQTGSRLNRNRHSFLALDTDALDRAALRAVRAALAKADAGAKVELLAGDEKLFAVANDALAADAGASLVASLRPALQGLGTTHWLIVSKFRGETRAKVREGTIGTGQLEGLGFYLDVDRSILNVDSGESTTGFVLPFAYLRFTLVDAATGQVIAEEREMETSTVAKQSATHPWEALTPEDKVAYLERLIQRSAADAVPRLVKR